MAKKDLNAAAQKATANFFSNATAETEKKGPEKEEQPEFTRKAEEKSSSEKEKKAVKKGFSFRGNPDDVVRWQNYGMAVKSTHAPAEKFRVDEIWCAAIEEYIENHPLDGRAKELYDQYMRT